MSGKRKILTLKEGVLDKYGGRFRKRWNPRFFVLSPQMLCYFKGEDMRSLTLSDQSSGTPPPPPPQPPQPAPQPAQSSQSSSKTPLPVRSRDRVFLSTITKISYVADKKRPYAFLVEAATYRQRLLLAAPTESERDEWMEAIKAAKEKEDREEETSDLRKSFRRLDSHLKRVTLVKEGGSIGCTIKICGGPVLVNRVVPDGPIAQTGVLKPGDQILEIHGSSLAGLNMDDIVKILKDAPTVFIATIRPMTSTSRPPIDPDAPPVDYAQIDYDKTAGQVKESEKVPFRNPFAAPSLPLLESLGVGDQAGAFSTDDDSDGDAHSGGHSPRPSPHPVRATRGGDDETSEDKVNYAELKWQSGAKRGD